ncbi:MAG: hypothetical protein JO108_26880, partial [Acidobacteriaceae bacterium]|nr:hypothetical protein [Acidobacteriaceae bacterium]
HFVWVDTNQHIQQLYWNGQAYGEQDLTAAAGAVSVMVGTGISAFVDPSSSAQHFVFIGSDQHVHQIVWNQTWSGTDFTAATAAPVPAGGALSIGGQQSGSQLPIFAPQSTTTLYAACNDQDGPIPYCNLTLQAGYYDNTNGHTHTNMQAPLSEISPGSGRSDGSGNLVVTLTTTRVGHQETIYECDTDHNICSVNDYLVGFSGLVLVNGSAQAILVGATPYHGNDNYYNHWMTTNALVGLSDTISAFLGAHPGQGQVALNDMALPYGGVFDLNRNWTSPHVSHDFGTAADVRGNTAQAAIPVSLQEQYRQTCLQNGAIDARIEYATPGDTDGYVQDPRRHIHCRWAY